MVVPASGLTFLALHRELSCQGSVSCSVLPCLSSPLDLEPQTAETFVFQGLERTNRTGDSPSLVE